jgi:hypothetical protein
MKTESVSASGLVKAPPDLVYNIIADYHNGHPHILPPQYFSDLIVEEGGVGTGTKIRFKLKVLGRVQDYYGVVSEPEPGRVLVEQYPEDVGRTIFTVEPTAGGRHTQVTFTTEAPMREGILGRLQRWLIQRILTPVYTAELQQLAAVAEQRLQNQ